MVIAADNWRDRVTRLVRASALASTFLVVVSAAAQGSRGEQILRPTDGAAPAILQAERVVRFVLRLPVEPEAAFDAWTDADQLVEWLSHWAEITVAEGEEYRIGWEGYDGVWYGRYLRVERPSVLSFTWTPPAEIFPSGAYETIVTLTFEQEEEGGGTLLTLEHTGFEGVAEMEAQLQSWRPYLFALRAYLLQPSVSQ